ncbi:MAG: Inositol-1-monophosphatase [Firmicutes bacterium ADurb.Bin419]|nr:MAG: Inositol-1-monophosphatase [Firmicutes bacterium ADurb.Bin419]
MIKELIRKAGYELKKDFYKLETSREKERFHLVTKSDEAIEKLLIDELKNCYPEYSIYSEEIGEINKNSGKRWIIDPIDGTADFVFGVPYFAISICLEVDNEIIEGYVYNPVSDELYYANNETGKAYLNDEIIKVSETNNIKDSLIAVGFSTNYKIIQQYYTEWNELFENCKKGMPLIAPALTICNVARGRIEAFVDLGSSMEGQSAASLILKNAGGKLYNYDFSEYEHTQKGIIATNGKIDLKRIRSS